MYRFLISLLYLAAFAMPATSWAATSTSSDLAINVTAGPATTGVQTPGPSLALFNNPYYTCVRNFYVATNGSDSNNGSSPSTPWRTIAYYESGTSPTAGDCVNVAPGSYSAFNGSISHGGTTASSTGYVVYRCTAPGADHNLPGGGGFSGSGCVINDGGKAVCAGSSAYCGSADPSYLIFDGFSFIAPAYNTFAVAIQGCYVGDTNASASCHHWIMVNNVIAGYGEAGIVEQNGDWFFALHNLIYANAAVPGCDAGSQGSGISFVASSPLTGYTQTADDIGPTPKLGIYGSTNPNPFHQFIEFNVVYNNRVNCASGAATDGNGIILDTNDKSGGHTIQYPYRFLVAFNISYNNGGGNIHEIASSNYTIANNTSFNGYLDPSDTGIARGSIDLNAGFTQNGSELVNNISWAIPGASPLNFNSSYLVGGGNNSGFYNGGTSCGLTVDGVATCGGNNISYTVGASSSDVAVYNTNPAWSCTGNKCMTDPLWVNVGNTGGNTGSAGTMSTPPAGTNFALQSGSPAIGYGVTRPYLSPQSVDAGACYHTLTSCP